MPLRRTSQELEAAPPSMAHIYLHLRVPSSSPPPDLSFPAQQSAGAPLSCPEACWELLHLLDDLASWDLRDKGPLEVTCLELAVLLPSESGNQTATNGEEDSSHVDEESVVSSSTGCFWAVWSSFPISFPFSYPVRTPGNQEVTQAVSDCSCSERQAAALTEA